MTNIKEKMIQNPAYILIAMLFLIEIVTFTYFDMWKTAYPVTKIIEGRRFYHTEYYTTTIYFGLFLLIQMIFWGEFIVIKKIGEVQCYTVFLTSSTTMLAGYMVQSLYGPTTIKRYLIFIGVCSVAFILTYLMFLGDMKPIIAELTQICIAIMLVLGIISVLQGRINGSSSWLFLSNAVSINPSEILRVLLIILAVYCYKKPDEKVMKRFMSLSILSIGVCILSGDIGSTIMSAVILGITYYFVEGKLKVILVSAGVMSCGTAVIVLIYKFLGKGYALQRIIDTGTHLLGTGQHHESLMGIAYGGITGVGVKKSILATHIVYSNTDFSFNVGVGVYGFVFALVAFVPFIMLVVIAIKARIIRARSNLLLVISASTMFIQATIHILCNLDVICYTGLCIPLLSSSGSNCLTYYVLLALLSAGLTPKIN